MITHKCACSVWLVLLELCLLTHSEHLVYDLVSSSEDRLVKTAGTAGFENFPTKKTSLRKG